MRHDRRTHLDSCVRTMRFVRRERSNSRRKHSPPRRPRARGASHDGDIPVTPDVLGEMHVAMPPGRADARGGSDRRAHRQGVRRDQACAPQKERGEAMSDTSAPLDSWISEAKLTLWKFCLRDDTAIRRAFAARSDGRAAESPGTTRGRCSQENGCPNVYLERLRRTKQPQARVLRRLLQDHRDGGI